MDPRPATVVPCRWRRCAEGPSKLRGLKGKVWIGLESVTRDPDDAACTAGLPPFVCFNSTQVVLVRRRFFGSYVRAHEFNGRTMESSICRLLEKQRRRFRSVGLVITFAVKVHVRLPLIKFTAVYSSRVQGDFRSIIFRLLGSSCQRLQHPFSPSTWHS